MSDAADASAMIDASQHNQDHGHEHEHGHGHGSPYLAHHFDDMEQQYDSGKLGMWVFLATELLMFGGLFCAYSVYRANHPDVFLHAHTYLNTTLGAINTAILLASSLTMAWAVRCSQLNQRTGLMALLLATLAGGAGFMVIKGIEYEHKFHDHLAPGYYNEYNTHFKGPADEGMNNAQGVKKLLDEEKAAAAKALPTIGIAQAPDQPYLYLDPHAGGADKAKIIPVYTGNTGLAKEQLYETHEEQAHAAPGEHGAADAHAVPHGGLAFQDMDSRLSQQRVNTFFGIYYCMTGLHGVHVLVGMGLIYWILLRAADSKNKGWIRPLPLVFTGAYLIFLGVISHVGAFHYFGVPILIVGGLWMALGFVRGLTVTEPQIGEFNEQYFAPVDLVGLYWHLVDLIWIFLFPLLYLIHGKVGS